MTKQKVRQTMDHSRYLIIGGGLTGDAACKGIREVDTEGAIVLVGDEPHAPYSRPPLSKALWKGAEEDTIWRRTADLGVDLRLDRRIVALDLKLREARDDHGGRYTYEKLLLATGGRPHRLPFGGDEVLYFRTLDDYRRLRALAVADARIVVIGGGFIGSEIAAALAMNARSVTMVFPEPGIGARLFPPDLSALVTDYYREHGVEVLAGTSVTAIDRVGSGLQVATADGGVVVADTVVAGLGIAPSVELADAAGLEVADGIVVDDRGRVAGSRDVFAAGDVARFPIAALGGTMRVEHEDHAKNHGRRVGANMAGEDEPYDHLPFFYSDLFDLGYEAVGELDSRLLTISEFSELDAEGTVYYVDCAGRPRGVLLWNLFGHVEGARDLIRAGESVVPGALRELVG
jgi:3-phenylpropionate/trans-cinnamate dioxygenase ferredoxin reductase subunit